MRKIFVKISNALKKLTLKHPRFRFQLRIFIDKLFPYTLEYEKVSIIDVGSIGFSLPDWKKRNINRILSFDPREPLKKTKNHINYPNAIWSTVTPINVLHTAGGGGTPNKRMWILLKIMQWYYRSAQG